MIGAITLSVGDFGVLAGIIGAQVGLLAAYVRSQAAKTDRDVLAIRMALEQTQSTIGQDVGAIRNRLDEFERAKVDRTEWVREAVSTRAKVDAVRTDLAEISGRLDANFGMAQAVGRLATSVDKYLETKA